MASRFQLQGVVGAGSPQVVLVNEIKVRPPRKLLRFRPVSERSRAGKGCLQVGSIRPTGPLGTHVGYPCRPAITQIVFQGQVILLVVSPGVVAAVQGNSAHPLLGDGSGTNGRERIIECQHRHTVDDFVGPKRLRTNERPRLSAAQPARAIKAGRAGAGDGKGDVVNPVASPDDGPVVDTKSQTEAGGKEHGFEIDQALRIAGIAGGHHRNLSRRPDRRDMMDGLIGNNHPRVLEIEVVEETVSLSRGAVVLQASTISHGQPGCYLPIVLGEEAEVETPGVDGRSGSLDLCLPGKAQEEVRHVASGEVTGELVPAPGF